MISLKSPVSITFDENENKFNLKPMTAILFASDLNTFLGRAIKIVIAFNTINTLS